MFCLDSAEFCPIKTYEAMSESAPLVPKHNAVLLLADGTVFYGYGMGAEGVATGEICFNTAMTGYQEVLTDPSYSGQIVTFTFPHIGNVGVNGEDMESAKYGANGLVVREPVTEPSSYRAENGLVPWLRERGITGICGVDTRALTRRIRLHGAQNAAIAYAESGKVPSTDMLMETLLDIPPLVGQELACGVSTSQGYEWKQTRWSWGEGYGEVEKTQYHVVAVDFGEKLNILRSLASRGCRVSVVPAKTTAKDILAMKPDGIFLSNGPGDPAATGMFALRTLRDLMAANVPIFGICLGHQLLALALGAKTEKMHQGHRGANHPVKNLLTGAVEITSQNHGFVVNQNTVPPEVEITHISLFDGTVEGLRHKEKPVFSVQYHPESSPGPHDSQYLFDQFVEMMESHAKKN